MKQVMVDLKNGKVAVEEVPIPAVQPGCVLVKNHYSVISGGTETALVNLAKASYIGKARMRPDLFKKVLDTAKKNGFITTYEQVMARLDKPEPTGYSCAGEIIAVGEGVDYKAGDMVACAGAGYANHADVVNIPKNLVVKVSNGVELRDAAFTTIGAIAMQGVRLSQVSLGSNVAVIGLGLIGQITIQLLKASGCNVIGIDLDPSKVKLAIECGADEAITRSTDNLENHVKKFTGGYGVDAVIVTAATKSNDPVTLAGEITRERGRVVLVGAVGMDIPRPQYYQKEIELIVSRSYGPGRYDREYEEYGADYPYAYCRWTENRNMESFVKLLEQKKLNLSKIITHEFGIEDASKAFQITNGEIKEHFVGIVIKYDTTKKLENKLIINAPTKKIEGQINVGVIGAGNFVTSTLLPNLKKVDSINLRGIASATGLSSKTVGSHYGFKYVTSDYKEILKDPEINAVLIATRNSSHAQMTIEALEHGKHVLVEKPLAVNLEQLEAIKKAHEAHPELVIQVGFNRRYAPMSVEMKNFFKNRSQPATILYRINAEQITKDSWIYDDAEGSGRVVTELCHFIDFLQYLVDKPITDYQAFHLNDKSVTEKQSNENVVLSLKFEDGSIGTIVYTTNGDSTLPKEYCEMHCNRSTAILKNFMELDLVKNGKMITKKNYLKQEKGHFQEYINYIYNIQNGTESLFETGYLTTFVTFNIIDKTVQSIK